MGAVLEARPVVVTGGANGIGAALAAEASARGASVVVVADVDRAAANAEARTVDMAEAFDHLATIDTTDYDVNTLVAAAEIQLDAGEDG